MTKRQSKPTPSDGYRSRTLRVGTDSLLTVEMDNATFLALKEIARREGATMGEIGWLAALKRKRDVTLSRAVHTFILRYFWEAATEDGHRKAGHGIFD